MRSVHEDHVSILVQPQLLIQPAHAADLRRYPDGVQLVAQTGGGGLHDQLLEAVLAASLARVGARDPLGSLTGDRCGQGQRSATDAPSGPSSASPLGRAVPAPSCGGEG